MKTTTHIRLIFIFLFLAFPAMMLAEVNQAAHSIFKVDVSSAKQYLDMAKKAREGSLPSDTEWDSLFNSKAYKALLRKTHWNRKEFKGNVKNAFDIVYNPDKRSICDSIRVMLDDFSNLKDELPMSQCSRLIMTIITTLQKFLRN